MKLTSIIIIINKLIEHGVGVKLTYDFLQNNTSSAVAGADEGIVGKHRAERTPSKQETAVQQEEAGREGREYLLLSAVYELILVGTVITGLYSLVLPQDLGVVIELLRIVEGFLRGHVLDVVDAELVGWVL